MKRILFCLTFILICFAGIATAQPPGNTFTRLGTVSPAVGTDGVMAGTTVSFPIIFGNRDTARYNLSNGFIIYSDADGIPGDGAPGSRGDGTATWEFATGDGGNYKGFSPDVFGLWIDTTGFYHHGTNSDFPSLFKFNCFGCNGAGADTIAFAAAGGLDGDGNPSRAARGLDSGVFFVIKILTKLSDHGKYICIDSTAKYPPTSTWKWVSFNYQPAYNTFPTWSGAKCFRVVDPNANSLAISKDTLSFTHVFGKPAPPSQTFVISSSPNSVPYTVSENSSWILKSPSLGNTPATITVTINPNLLSIGSYFDSLTVESGNAINSPQFVYVKLNVIPPPPTIAVAPTQLFFSAVLGGANPLPKELKVTNAAAGSVLNWSLSKSQSWLGLSPMTGVDSGTVAVTPDITGLPLGTYKDTIYVSDPTATNNPVKVPVTLQIGSNLPIIEADPITTFFVVRLNELIQFTRQVSIRNAGAGQLDFKVTENAYRITKLTPDTAQAPALITVLYKIANASDGEIVSDTIWITSDQAANSPYPVVITLRFVQDPAFIGTSLDTIKFNVFECSQGLADTLPWSYLNVENVGQDDPMVVALSYSSEFFTINRETAVAPYRFRVSALNPDTALGTYLDTILITAQNALNNPRRVIVEYNRLAAQQAPVISTSKTFWVIPYLEGSGPSERVSMDVNNMFGGCMPWTAESDIPWAVQFQEDGVVPGGLAFNVDAPGYTLGTYYDTLVIFAPTAANSPYVVPMELRVWKLRCDVDWSGNVDIADLTGLISFLYLNGPSPKPAYFIGDCDCDDEVDIADLTRMIDYLYLVGPVICGNPY